MEHNVPVVQEEERQLSIEEWMFVGEYVKEGSGVKAMKAAGYQGHYAADAAYKMLKKPWIQRELRRAGEEVRKSTSLDVRMVVDDVINILNADPRDLIQFVTGSCRHCHGVDHLYQRTAGEMKRDRRRHNHDAEAQLRGIPFDEMGGEGFNAFRDPHPECTECFGKGVQLPRLRDTRELSPETAALYAGIRQTKHGLEFILRSKDAAREAAAKFLGINKETIDVNVKRKLEDYTDDELLRLMNEKR